MSAPQLVNQVLARVYKSVSNALAVEVVAGIISGTFQATGLQVAGKITMLTVDNTQWFQAPVTALAGRNNIQIQNPATSTADLILNYDPSAPLTDGLHIVPGSSYSIAIRGTIPVYLTRASAGTVVAVIEELA